MLNYLYYLFYYLPTQWCIVLVEINWLTEVFCPAICWKQQQRLQVSLSGSGKEHHWQRCLLQSQGEVWNPTWNWLVLKPGRSSVCVRCFLWHGIQHPRGSLPHCELGQEQRPWGTGSPDMRGTPPTSSLGPRLLPWTMPAKESSLTEARAQQQCRGFGAEGCKLLLRRSTLEDCGIDKAVNHSITSSSAPFNLPLYIFSKPLYSWQTAVMHTVALKIKCVDI